MTTTTAPTARPRPMQRFLRWLTAPGVILLGVVMALVVLLGAFIVSFTTLRDLAAGYGIPEEVAWLWPVIVDGATVAATLVTFAARNLPRRERVLPILVLGLFAIVSVIGNVVHDLIPLDEWPAEWQMTLKIFVRSVPPVALFLTMHLSITLVQIVGPQSASEAAPEVAAASAPAPAAATAVAPVGAADEIVELVSSSAPAPAASVDPAPVAAAIEQAPSAPAPVAETATPVEAAAAAAFEPAEHLATITTLPTAAAAPADDMATVTDHSADAASSAPASAADASAAVAAEIAAPTAPADQVAWVVDRQRMHGDVTWQLIAEYLGVSDRQAQRRLTDARKTDAAAFAA